MMGTSSPPSDSSPRHPRLVFRVGVVGHRLGGLQAADMGKLKQVLRELLAFVKNTVEEFRLQAENQGLHADEPALLQAVSPLAEGTDRLFAEQALDLDYALCCPMPFFQDEYKNDFDDASKTEFDRLLQQARDGAGLVTFELEGDRAREGESYGAAGTIVLNQSDLLIAVWDGWPPKGEGGTAQTLREAFHYDVPVLCVKASDDHPWTLARSETDTECLYASAGAPNLCAIPPAWYELHKIVTDTLKVPPEKGSPHFSASLREAFFYERKPRWNLMFWWKQFRDLLDSWKMRLPAIRVPDFQSAVAEEWPTGVEGVTAWLNERLRPHYAWSDKLADIYADAYRSTYVLAYLLVAAAVFLALSPVTVRTLCAAPGFTTVCIISEGVCLSIVLGLVFWSRHRRWHDRWMEYRLLAEFIRQLRLTIPWGGGWPFPARPQHLTSYGDPLQSWMYWHMRAIARATGLPTTKIDNAYIDQCVDHLQSVVKEQMAFHEHTCRRAERIMHRLHMITLCLLVLTIGSVVIHLVLHLAGGHAAPLFEDTLTFVCAGFPALGAALAGINNQGEFARIMKRSEAMANGLAQLSDEIDRVSLNSAGEKPAIRLRKMWHLGVRAANLMVGELLDWQVIFLDRPPVLPV